MKNTIVALFRDESGASAVEYGVILGLIVIAMVAGLGNFADAMSNKWNFVHDESKKAMD